MSKVFRASHKRIRENKTRNSKHGDIDMSVFHHESTPRNPNSTRRSVRPPTTESMLRSIQNSPRPKKCGILFHCFLILFSISLSIPELAALNWWEDISNTSQWLSWGPFVVVLISIAFTVVSVFCTNRLIMFLSVTISFFSLPLIVAQLAVCSTPAVLTLCCCFPSQCLLSLTHTSDRLSDHIHLNETCRYMIPVTKQNYECASSRAYFILFWLSSASSLIFTAFLVNAQWYWIRSPAWKFVKEIQVNDGRVKIQRKREYHRQEDEEEDVGAEQDYFTSEEEEEESESEEYYSSDGSDGSKSSGQESGQERQRRHTKKGKGNKKRRKKKKSKFRSTSSSAKSRSKKYNRKNKKKKVKTMSSSEEENERRRDQGSESQRSTVAEKIQARTVMKMLSARVSESESSSSSDEGEPVAPSIKSRTMSKYGKHSSVLGLPAPAPSSVSNNVSDGSQFFSPRETLKSSQYT